MIHNAGIAALAQHIVDTYLGVAIGTGTGAETATDTTLGTEVMRSASTNTRVTTTVTNDTAQLTAVFDIDNTYNITESGVLTSSTSGGTMLSRKMFTAIPATSGDVITFIWKEKVS